MSRIISGVVGQSVYTLPIWKDTAERLLSLLAQHEQCENQEIVFLRQDGTPLTGLMSAGLVCLRETPPYYHRDARLPPVALITYLNRCAKTNASRG
jgi:hypothetical protein